MPKINKLTPQVWDYAHNLADLKGAAVKDHGPTFTVGWHVPGYTTYDSKTFFSTCKG